MRFWLIFALTSLALQAQGNFADLANQREDLRLLNQRVGELVMRVEALERENSTLQRKADVGEQHLVTLVQFNEAVGELNRNLRAGLASTKAETLQIVATQLEKLATQTNVAIESVSRGQAARVASGSAPSGGQTSAPQTAGGFSDNYPKEGIHYTVVAGDTLAKIAKKTGSRSEYIINANKLADPSKLYAGQALFIPLAK